MRAALLGKGEKIMRQLILAAFGSVGFLGFLATSPAAAQALRPVGSPGISPYLNLVRPGASPAINYYGIVRPQLQYNTAINSLEQQVAASKVAITAQESLNVPTTGHQVAFLRYQQYFLNVGAVSPFQNIQATAGAGTSAGASAGYGGSAASRALSNINSGATTPSTPSSFRR
jgi:hypothetical protein